VRLLRGRDLAAADRRDAVPVTLVSAELARRLWPGQDPLGKRLALSYEALRFRPDGPPTIDFPPAYRTVVGVVADVRQEGPGTAPLPAMYVPFAQRPPAVMTLVVRGTLSAEAVARAAGDALRELDRGQPVGEAYALDAALARAVGTPRARAALTGAFA